MRCSGLPDRNRSEVQLGFAGFRSRKNRWASPPQVATARAARFDAITARRFGGTACSCAFRKHASET